MMNPDVVKRTLDRFDLDRSSERHHSRLPLGDLSFRDATQTADGSYIIAGHASTVAQEYVLFENDHLRVRERINPRAFDAVLETNPLVHLNIGHDQNRAIAATDVAGLGGLELSMDDVGLRFFARVDPEDPDVIGLRSKMRLGVIRQSSFAFTIDKETRTETEGDDDRIDVLYEINNVGQLYDVCVCAQGANPYTDSSIRTLTDAVGQPDASASWATHRQPGEALGDVNVSPADDSAVGVLVSKRVQFAQAQSLSKSARSKYT